MPTSYYLRAFAKNAHGTSLSSPKRFRTQPPEASTPIIAGAEHKGNGWYDSSWFGTFYQAPNGWLLHDSMGWIYPSGNPPQGIWFWTDRMGWNWTSSRTYPYVWMDATLGWWYYFGLSNGHRIFYDYDNKKLRYR